MTTPVHRDDQLQERTVIVLDDEPLTLELMVDLIELSGGVALRAATAQAAREQAARHPDVSLLICDIMLGGQAEGLTVANEIAASIPTCGVLLTSGVSTESSSVSDRNERFHFLQKPFGVTDFARALAEVLDE